MKLHNKLADEAVLVELGNRLAQRRLDLRLSQAALAEQAGVSKRTLERVEAGAATQTGTFVRILRALELLDQLDGLVPEAGPRPLDLLKLKGKERRRAPRRKMQADPETWRWGNDT